MSLSFILQCLVSGLMMGAVFALLGVGFSFAWGVMKVINIAHAAFALLGAFLAYSALAKWKVDPVVTSAALVPVLFLTACLIYRIAIKPITIAKDVMVSSMIVTFGLTIILENLMLLIWSSDPRVLTTSYITKVIILGPLYFQYPRLIASGMSFVSIILIYAFMKKTYTGKAVRAAWQEPDGARLYGVNFDRINMVTFGLALASAGAGGVGMAFMYSFEPSVHNLWLIFIFLVVILGGVGNLLGTAVAGLIVGVITGLGFAFLPYQWVNVATFGLLMVILIFRPQGLFGGAV
jgi:branched-chain amino acid transport system permease protein